MPKPAVDAPLNDQQFGSTTDPDNCAYCGRKLPKGQKVYCSRAHAYRDKE